MKFTTLTEEEFRTFLDHHPLKTFMQTPEIGKLRANSGWNYVFLGVKEKEKILAATMLLSKPEFKGYLEFYAPRGLLIDYHNQELLRFFTENLKEYINNQNGYILRIDPYLIKQERDINGDIVKDGIDNQKVISYLEELGYQKADHDEQVKWAFSLNLENKTSDDIMKEMKPNVRNIIRKALKNGIVIRELELEELNQFKAITESTSERRDFLDKPLGYYQDMYHLFHDQNGVRYLLAELNLHEYKKRLEEELNEIIKEIETTEKKHSTEGKLKAAEIRKENFEKRIKEAKELIKNNKENTIPLSGAMFITYGDEIIYLCSGTDGKYMFFNGQYLIQWEMIQWGIKHHYKKYNFYGISGNFDKKDPDYGIYEFKKGFNGYVEETIGEYQLPINNIYNKFHRYLQLKQIIKKILRKK